MNLKGVETVLFKGHPIAMVFRRDIAVDNVTFFTDPANPFQVGLHQRPKGTILTPHIHKLASPLKITAIQELLFVVRGSIRITLYTNRGEAIAAKVLKSGDSVLFLSLGHGIEFLKDSRVFEIKQGPYPGSQNAKIYFEKPHDRTRQ